MKLKSILVPTDFSACAHYAMDAAAQLAKQHGASVFLYTCLPLPKNWEFLPDEEKDLHRDAQISIENTRILHNAIRKKHPETAFFSRIGGGKFLQKIEQYVSDWSVDLIVMGSHGVSGKSEYFIGSKTQKVVRKVHCPVLVLKDPVKVLTFRQVVFASDFESHDRRAFQHAVNFLGSYQPNIHLVKVSTPSLSFQSTNDIEAAMSEFAEIAAPLSCQMHVLRDLSVDAGLRFFSEQIGADLLILANRHRHPLYRMLQGSKIETLVNHAKIPLLAIDFNSGK